MWGWYSCRDIPSVKCKSWSGLFLIDWQVLFPQAHFFLSFDSCMYFYFTDWSFTPPESCTSPTPAPNPLWSFASRDPGPWQPLTSSLIGCYIDGSPHTQPPPEKQCRDIPYKILIHPHHCICFLLPSIHSCMHTFIHPSVQSPTLQP